MTAPRLCCRKAAPSSSAPHRQRCAVNPDLRRVEWPCMGAVLASVRVKHQFRECREPRAHAKMLDVNAMWSVIMNRLLYVPIRTESTHHLVSRNSMTTILLCLLGLAVLFVLSWTYPWVNLLIVSLVNLCTFLLVLSWLDAKSVRACHS